MKAANAFSRVSQSFCCQNIGFTPLLTARNRFFNRVSHKAYTIAYCGIKQTTREFLMTFEWWFAYLLTSIILSLSPGSGAINT
nr:Homoserine/homoserine lactone efflux protein [Raoultella sp. NCTC 9187]